MRQPASKIELVSRSPNFVHERSLKEDRRFHRLADDYRAKLVARNNRPAGAASRAVTRPFALVLVIVMVCLVPTHTVTSTSMALAARSVPAKGAQSLRLLIEPQAGMAEIDAILRSAKTSVDLEIYELTDPTIETILCADARRGVNVRVILNEHYTESENAAAFSYLSERGVAVRWAPPRFDITHEKAVVVDDRTALIMTMNFTPEYYATTRDVVVIDNQSADVKAISVTFDEDWAGSHAPPADGRDLLWSPDSEQALLDLIGSARQSILIENEEMDEPYIESALEQAARRGVRITVVMTEDPEWNSAFSALSIAGVRIRLYPSSPSALYIHAKVVDVDPGLSDGRAFVGSENFSVASLLYNRELGILTSDRSVVEALATMIERDAERATATWR
jgi:cardiolipin synthase A/B